MGVFQLDYFKNLPYGMGVHKLIVDANGAVVDFELMAYNMCYTTVFGLDVNQIFAGITYSEICDLVSENRLKTPKELEGVGLKGETFKYKQYNDAEKSWYSIMFYAPEKGYCVCLITKECQVLEPKLQALFDQTNDGVILMDLEGQFFNANKRAAEMLGYDMEELVSMSFKHISGEIEDTKKVMQKAILGEWLPPYERVFLRKDGTTLYVEINLELIYDDRGSPAYFQSIVRDITERKKNEMDLIHLNKMQMMVSNIASSLVKVNRDNYHERITGILKLLIQNFAVDHVAILSFDTRIETVYVTHEYYPPNYHSELCDLKTFNVSPYLYWRDRIKKGETVWIEASDHEQFKLEDGRRLKSFGITAILTIPFFEEHTVVGAVLFETPIASTLWNDRDIHFLKVVAHMLNDARKRHLNEIALMEAISVAEVANKAKTQFLANMSHEIRTPLNGILGFLGLLSETTLSSNQAFYVHHAKESGNALLAIVNDVLDISKIEAGKLILESLKVDLPLLLESLYENMKILAQKKNIEVNLIENGVVPKYIWADPTRLRQVLMNLMNNGIKFTDKGSVTLTVHFSPENKRFGQLTFRVIDTGIGIGKDAMDTVFKAFTQGDLSTTRKYGGTGLGLTISSKIVSQMNGKLEFVSHVGKGSEFFFTIKVPFLYDEKIQLNQLGDASVQNSQVTESRLKLLIVEDMDINRLLLKKIMEKQYPQMEIIEASSGVDAVDLFKQSAFDLVIMDVQMPKMDGLEATRALRKIDYENKTHTPIVALSAGALEEEKQKCFLAGMDDFVSKPIDKEVLFRVINTYLSSKL